MKSVLFSIICVSLMPVSLTKANISDKNTQLIQAAKEGSLATVQSLLADGANPNTKDENGHPVLLWASYQGYTEVVKLLLDKGANVNAKVDIRGTTALMIASLEGHTDVVRLLLDNGADVNAKGTDGETALMVALLEGRKDIVKLLLDKGANVNEKMTSQALIMARDRSHASIVRLLLDKGANINAKTSGGITSLMVAVLKGHTEVVKLLLDNGADVNARTTMPSYERSALDFAKKMGYTEIVQLLEKAGQERTQTPAANEPVPSTRKNAVVHEPNIAEQAVKVDSTVIGPNSAMRTVLNEGYNVIVLSVKFSPDGKYLASGGENQSVKLWDCSNGKLINNLRGHIHGVKSLSFSPDGRFIASGDNAFKAGEIRFWEFESGDLLKIMKRNESMVLGLSFSSNSKNIISCGWHGFEIWNYATGKPERRELLLSAIGPYIGNTAWETISMDGEMFAYISDILKGKRTIELYNTRTGRHVRTLEYKSEITAISLSNSGQYLAATSADGMLRVLSMENGRELAVTEITKKNGTNNTNALCFSPNDYSVALGQGNALIIWDWETKGKIRIVDTLSEIWAMDWSPKDDSLATGGRKIDLWDTTTGTCLRSFGDVESEWVLDSQPFPDKRHFAFQTGKKIYIYDIFNYELTSQISEGLDGITAMDVSTRGSYIAVGNQTGVVKIWDVNRGEYIKQLNAHEGKVEVVRFAPDERNLLSHGIDGLDDKKEPIASMIKAWEIDTGKMAKVQDSSMKDVLSMSFSSDGRFLASANRNGPIRVWDFINSKLIKTLSGNAHLLAFAPDGLSLTSGSSDGSIKIWNVNKGSSVEVLKPEYLSPGHPELGWVMTNAIECLSYSPDGRKIAYGTDGGKVGLLDVEKGQLYAETKCHDQSVKSVTFDSNRACLISTGWDGVRIIDTATLKVLVEIHVFPDASVTVTPEGFFVSSCTVRHHLLSLSLNGANNLCFL